MRMRSKPLSVAGSQLSIGQFQFLIKFSRALGEVYAWNPVQLMKVEHRDWIHEETANKNKYFLLSMT